MWYRLGSNALMALGLSLLLALGGAARAQQGDAFGALGQFLPPTGQEGAWKTTNTGDSFEIENIGDPGAITYFFAPTMEGSEGSRMIRAAIGIHPEAGGSAGVLYGLDQKGPVYHVLALSADGTVSLFRRDGDGFRPFIESTTDAFRPGEMNVLRIQEAGDTITYFLNDTQLGEVGGGLYGRGQVGIAAVGPVRALYTGFEVTAGQ